MLLLPTVVHKYLFFLLLSLEKYTYHYCATLLQICHPDRFSISLLYYGLSLNVGTFGLSIHLTQLLFGFVELPANVGAYVLIQRLGRKKCQSSFILFGGVSCLATLAVPPGLLKAVGTFFFLFLLLKS